MTPDKELQAEVAWAEIREHTRVACFERFAQLRYIWVVPADRLLLRVANI